MRKVRDAIKLGAFSRFRKEYLEKLQENTPADV
jgi:queuine/archaeosine tRNA-ribosyltransferase